MFSLKERNDSWQNFLTGLGGNRDKASYHHLYPNNRFSPEYLEQLYINDDIAARIIDLVPHEMMRQGLSINGESTHKLNMNHHLFDALIKARLFGVAFIFLGVEDGDDQACPWSRKSSRDSNSSTLFPLKKYRSSLSILMP